jgi:hypothetical protein
MVGPLRFAHPAKIAVIAGLDPAIYCPGKESDED